LDGGNTNAIEIKTISNTLTEALGTRQGSSSEFIRSVEKIAEATGRIRRLTPVECERLQGFPDGWTEGVSDTQRYKMLGNAVTVNVIEAIAKEVKNERLGKTYRRYGSR
jgi:DNA (cytosine-5)-methyltransferase 1